MQPTRIDAFEAELQTLCRTHRASLAVTQDGSIGVWDLSETDRPVYDLVDCRRPVPADVDRSNGVPDSFFNGLSASLHAGFVSKEGSRSAALRVAGRLPDAKVVPIGCAGARREWAVIGPLPGMRMAG